MAARGLTALIVALSAMITFAPSAGAVLLKQPHGRVFGLLPHRGINPQVLPRTFVHPSSSAASPRGSTDGGNVDYHDGPVLHAEAPYLVFWDPNNQITTTQKALLERYFTDATADSGASSNIFGVLRQYTDATGYAQYTHSFSTAQAITDTEPYPLPGAPAPAGQCTEHASGYTETACLYDSQIQTELTRLITADSLPTGSGGTAPIYFVVTPPTVNTCQSDNSTCADSYYCAYHSNYSLSGSQILYADIPMLLASQSPKSCQDDRRSLPQEPNGHYTDVMTSSMSHEFSETITDPVNGTGWWDDNSGNETGDNCAFTGALDPADGTNPDAFLPTLGGSATGGSGGTGTLFDQLINGDSYYTQTEWSNGDTGCRAEPTPSSLVPGISVSSRVNPGTVSLDPSGSASTGGYSSNTWTFGDGSTPQFSTSAPQTVNHSYTAGTYTVSLGVVDGHGNVATASRQITVGDGPVAAFAPSTTHLIPGASATFISSSGDDNSTIPASGYSWTFGDGSSSTQPTPQHSYATTGRYPVTLTVTDQNGVSASITNWITVGSPPAAAFSASPRSPLPGQGVNFDGSSSSEPGGSIVSYAWDFGDGDSASGVQPAHPYTAPGTYVVTLTVTDAWGYTAQTTESVMVAPAPTAMFGFTPSTPDAGSAVSFDGSGSHANPSGGALSYHWAFGDGGTDVTSGATPRHAYGAPGTYDVVLTVTDGNGHTASASHAVSVAPAPVTGVPTAVIGPAGAHPVARVTFGFSGSASRDAGSSLTSYRWSFGDGSGSGAVNPSHVYAKPGRYALVLTVVDATGASSTSSQTVTVGSARITRVKVRTGARSQRITFTLNGPGTLLAAGHRYRVRHPGTLVSRLALTPAQRASLAGRHRVHVRLVAKFVPASGNVSRRTVAFVVKP